jgi:catechol 2,3-dioxygenase-like lactoylglutathione lyase family enzyme
MTRAVWISVTPELPVADVREAQRWYRDVLGWKMGWVSEDESYGALYVETLELFLRQAAILRPGGVTCIRVSDVESVHTSCLEAGGKIMSALDTKPWQMREFSVEVPDGNVLRIGQSTLVD